MKRTDERGFTLLEVMVSLFIFSVVLGGMAPAFVSHMKQNTDSEIRTAAIAASQQVLDGIRLQDITALPTSGAAAPQTITIDGKPFSVVVRYCVDTAYCSVTSTRHLTIETSYRGERKFETETVFTQLR